MRGTPYDPPFHPYWGGRASRRQLLFFLSRTPRFFSACGARKEDHCCLHGYKNPFCGACNTWGERTNPNCGLFPKPPKRKQLFSKSEEGVHKSQPTGSRWGKCTWRAWWPLGIEDCSHLARSSFGRPCNVWEKVRVSWESPFPSSQSTVRQLLLFSPLSI